MVSYYHIGQHIFNPFQTYAPNWMMIHLIILPDKVSDKYTCIPCHLDEETLPQRIMMACSHTAWSRTEPAPGPAPSFPPHGAQSTSAPSPVAQTSPQDLHPVSIFGQLTPQLILCDPQLQTWPEPWLRQTLPEPLESVCMVRPLYAHTPKLQICRFSDDRLWRDI